MNNYAITKNNFEKKVINKKKAFEILIAINSTCEMSSIEIFAHNKEFSIM